MTFYQLINSIPVTLGCKIIHDSEIYTYSMGGWIGRSCKCEVPPGAALDGWKIHVECNKISGIEALRAVLSGKEVRFTVEKQSALAHMEMGLIWIRVDKWRLANNGMGYFNTNQLIFEVIND